MMIFLINCDLIIFNIKKIKIGLCCLAKQENKYINKNFVELINYRGLDKPQNLAYAHCYNINKKISRRI